MKLSIITINRNNSEGLNKTIESIVSQAFIDFEYIVIDGASTDASVDIIKQYEDKITYWISEPDNGVYNAMNKGILKASGEYCLFLNSGDWLVDKKVISDFINSKFTEDIVSGNLMLIGNGESVLRKAIKLDDLGFEHLYNNRIPHPSTFIRKDLFNKYGLYNEDNKIVSDWEFFLLCLIIHNCSYSNFDRVISNFYMNGISSNPLNYSFQDIERQAVFNKYVPRIYKSFEKYNAEIERLNEMDREYNKYMNLKNGKFRFVIKFILKIKQLKLRSV
jgi:glycosyltransferase involved in cell wall biosynthesis